jgi:hypothetical protein
MHAYRRAHVMSHVFISYVRDNSEVIQRLSASLEARGVNVWLDRDKIRPGYRWKAAIRDAIREGAFFIACFSREYHERPKTYMNEELTLAIEELRQRPTDRAWFIPVLLPGGEVPDRDIGAGETFRSLQWVSLSEEDWNTGIQRILSVVQIKPVAGAIADSTEATQLNQQPAILRAPRWLRWMGRAAIGAVLLSSTLNGGLPPMASRIAGDAGNYGCGRESGGVAWPQ